MGTVIIFGAGATKACGGPLTNEILPLGLKLKKKLEREGFIQQVEAFLQDNFHLSKDSGRRRPEDFPALPLLLSLIDTAIDRQQSFSAQWGLNELRDVRAALEYLIFAVLEYLLGVTNARNHYHTMLRHLMARKEDLAVISLNYDIIADNTLIALTKKFPEYGCDIATSAYVDSSRSLQGRKRIQLFKPHGSLNWIYCPACQRLDIALSSKDKFTIKALGQFYGNGNGNVSLEDRYSCTAIECAERDCRTPVRPIMITPTHRKDYRNPHIARVWYEAGRALRHATNVHVIGYSLPPDDVDVIYLLKSNLAHLPAQNIAVVDYDRAGRSLHESEVGSRYRTLFGDKLRWFPRGFGPYVAALQKADKAKVKRR